MSFINKLYTTIYWITPKFLINWVINSKINEYGEILDYSLDNKNKKIFIKFLLAGENEPIEVSINNYKIKKTDDANFLFIANDASSNKKWINALLRNVLVGKELPIPADKAELIDEFLG